MVIRETGVMVRGFPLVYSSYHQTGENIDIVLRSGLLSGILIFIEGAYLDESIEYIESKNYTIAFKVGLIEGKRSHEPEPIVAYVILDKEKKLDKFISKKIIPFLKKVLKQFIEENTRKNLSNISNFTYFRANLDRLFKVESKSLEEKFKGLL